MESGGGLVCSSGGTSSAEPVHGASTGHLLPESDVHPVGEVDLGESFGDEHGFLNYDPFFIQTEHD